MMWIFPDDTTPSDYLAKTGDIVVVTTTEFGEEDRRVALVMETEGDSVNVIMLPDTDPHSFGFDGG